QNRFVPQVANDLGADDGFAGAGRGHQDDALAAGGDGAVELGYDVVLIGAQFYHAAPVRDRGHCSPAARPVAMVFSTERSPSSAIRPLRSQASISRSSTSRSSSSPPATS